MKRKPLSPEEPIIDREGKSIIALGLLIDIFTVALYLLLLKFSHLDVLTIRTLMFAMIGSDSLFYVFVFKSLRKPFWRENLLNNKLLLVSVATGFAAIFGGIYWPVLNRFLGTVPLNWFLVMLILVIGLTKSVVMEWLMLWYYKDEQ